MFIYQKDLDGLQAINTNVDENIKKISSYPKTGIVSRLDFALSQSVL